MTDAPGYLQTVAAAESRTGAARWAEAASLWLQVVEHNPVNGSHWDRLARARFELGDYRGALTAYARAAELGVWGQRTETVFPAEIAYRMACCHARLDDHDRAVRELVRAIRLGFRDLDRPQGEEHWKPFLADGAVRDLLGMVDAESLSRDEGWRTDIRFLSREIKRRAVDPFKNLLESDFDASVDQLARSVPALSDAQIIAGLMRLIRQLEDGHAFVGAPGGHQELDRILPVKFYLFSEGLFITAATSEYQRLLGARVLEVGGHPVADVLAALEPLISRDNAQQVRWLAPELLGWPPMLHALGLIADQGIVSLTVRFPDQAAGPVAVIAEAPAVPRTIAPSRDPARPCPAGWISLADTLPGPLPLYLRHCDDRYWFEFLPACGLVYFQFNGVTDQWDETLAAFCDRLFAFIDSHQVSGLVIDLRWNGGGDTFLTQPLLHHLIGCAKTGRPGGLFVIIGRGTFSAAQNIATAIERETSAIFVGEPSGSRPNFAGETVPFRLPCSGTVANVSDLYWQTSWPADYRPWIAPEIYAPPTFEAYGQNRDPAMEAIIAEGPGAARENVLPPPPPARGLAPARQGPGWTAWIRFGIEAVGQSAARSIADGVLEQMQVVVAGEPATVESSGFWTVMADLDLSGLAVIEPDDAATRLSYLTGSVSEGVTWLSRVQERRGTAEWPPNIWDRRPGADDQLLHPAIRAAIIHVSAADSG